MGKEQKNAFMAVLLSGLVLVIWQMFFMPEPMPKVAVPGEAAGIQGQVSSNTPQDKKIVIPGTIAKMSLSSGAVPLTLQQGERLVSFNSNLQFSNILDTSAQIPFKEIVESEVPFQINVLTADGEREIALTVVESSTQKLTATDSALGLQFFAFLDERGIFNYQLNASEPLRYRFVFNSLKRELENNRIRNFEILDNSVTRTAVGKEDTGESKAQWMGIDFNYHLFANAFDAKKAIKYTMTESGKMYVDTIAPAQQINGRLVFARKNYDYLDSIGGNLHLSVDFGFFHFIAVPILRMLQFFYKTMENYGVSIILLTLVIRLFTFPFQYKSFKSMKKMQVVQPELQLLREKYKDNPQKMQQETMALFKKAGANPLSGCLPMLLQMPFFFAFYQVLNNSVELVGSPFFGWIHDLSVKDPFYVLPVLMGGAMFLQQKLTPSSSADPTQQKVMMFMPLIFCFIMKDLAAGLNLYIFISTLFAIIQQLFVYRTVETT